MSVSVRVEIQQKVRIRKRVRMGDTSRDTAKVLVRTQNGAHLDTTLDLLADRSESLREALGEGLGLRPRTHP